MDAEQCLAGEGPPQAVVQEPMERADAERSNRQPLDARRIQRFLQPGRLGAGDGPLGEEHEDTARSKSSQRERERVGRGCVEPLNVVDCKQNRFLLAEQVQHITYRHGKRALINWIVRGLLAKQRDLERSAPRRRDRRGDVGEGVFEQIAQP